MVFNTLSDFIVMEGHGVYVWSAYGVALLIVLYNLLTPVIARRKLVVQLQRQARLDDRQKQKVNATCSARKDLQKPGVVEQVEY
ncbi:heme exporter protein CcmD [Candidatus Sororendozoicomonas aggregata]|uniref:heme exporter protein CcmD n=1 Tax=Candidatus Sororendozoicomonas aggregata TaxID=3073239 RepID=UPI002ED3FCD5